MQEGHTDYFYFDERTKNTETGETTVTLILLDDWELGYFANEEIETCTQNGFDAQISKIVDKKINYIQENKL